MNTYENNVGSNFNAVDALRGAAFLDRLDIAELNLQGERIGENLRIFANTSLMSDHAVAATRLQALVDVIRNETLPPDARHEAAWEVMDQVTGPVTESTGKDVDYTFNLWRDMPVIDKEAQRYWRRLDEHGSDDSLEAIEKLNGNMELTEEDWDVLRIGVDVPSIVKLSQHVNVESIFARSGLILDRVATASVYDSNLIKDILEIETVYAPLLDSLGLHASEALLRHHCEKARLMATGRDDVKESYDTMSQYIESVRDSHIIDSVMTDVVGIEDVSREKFDFIVDNRETPYGSRSYFSAIRSTSEANVPFRFISRIKSPGSATDKMLHHYKGEMPQDIYAGTVVVNTASDLVSMFKEVYGNIKALEKEGLCELVTTANREHPIHIKGNKAYMDAVEGGLGNEFEGGIDKAKPVEDDVEEPFQVLKVTFNIKQGDKVLPVEIQFQTIADRNSSRLGGASHLSYHANGKKKTDDETKSDEELKPEIKKEPRDLPGNIPGTSSDLWSVNQRKWDMLKRGGDEELHHEKDSEKERRRIEEVKALQDLVIVAAFHPDELAYAA